VHYHVPGVFSFRRRGNFSEVESRAFLTFEFGHTPPLWPCDGRPARNWLFTPCFPLSPFPMQLASPLPPPHFERSFPLPLNSLLCERSPTSPVEYLNETSRTAQLDGLETMGIFSLLPDLAFFPGPLRKPLFFCSAGRPTIPLPSLAGDLAGFPKNQATCFSTLVPYKLLCRTSFFHEEDPFTGSCTVLLTVRMVLRPYTTFSFCLFFLSVFLAFRFFIVWTSPICSFCFTSFSFLRGDIDLTGLAKTSIVAFLSFLCFGSTLNGLQAPFSSCFLLISLGWSYYPPAGVGPSVPEFTARFFFPGLFLTFPVLLHSKTRPLSSCSL